MKGILKIMDKLSHSREPLRKITESIQDRRIQQVWSRILSLALNETTVEALHVILDTLMSNHFHRTITLEQGKILYRARHTEDRPASVRDVGMPPNNIVSFGRVNTPGNPVFYAAETREIALEEIGAVPDCHVAMSTWRLREKLLVGNLGFTGSGLYRLNPDVGVPAWKTRPSPYEEPELDDQHRRYCEEVENFLGEIFLLEVPSSQKFLYKLSIAAAKALGFDPLGDRIVTKIGQYNYRITGTSPAEAIFYPSVAHQAKGGNVAIRRQSLEKLELQDVEYLKMAAGENGTARPTGVDFSNSVGEGQRLEWKGRSVQYQLTSPGQIAKWVYKGDDTFEIRSDQPLRRV